MGSRLNLNCKKSYLTYLSKGHFSCQGIFVIFGYIFWPPGAMIIPAPKLSGLAGKGPAQASNWPKLGSKMASARAKKNGPIVLKRASP
jgi:hypothetical protein